MILTEEEAKTKWCPETRIHEVRGAGVYVNKPITDENPHGHANAASVLCIGSACMAWRWRDPQPEIPIFVSGESNDDFVKRRDRVLAARIGYC